MEKVLLVVGMGPGVGMGMARVFGTRGYRVGMIARNHEKLQAFAQELQQEGIQSFSFIADVMDRDGLLAAIARARQQFGRIDVLEYSPLMNFYGFIDILRLDAPAMLEQLEFQLLGAITSAQAVMNEMIERRDGALLFTLGASAYLPAPSHSNGSIAVAALRHYAVTLHVALKPHNVYVGSVAIGRPFDAEEVAEQYWDMMSNRDRCETLLGDPRLMSAYDELVSAGLGIGYPARLTGDLPPPVNERDRHLQLVSLAHISKVMSAIAPDEAEQRRIEHLVLDRGGDLDAPLYGGDLDRVIPYPALR